MGNTTARLTLAAVLLALLGSLCSVPATANNADPRDTALAREILKELIGIHSTHERGTTEAAKSVAWRLAAAGFAPADIQLLVPDESPQSANLVTRIHGRGNARPILYICHLDVVEAKPEDWSRDPFVLTEADGYLYGRGTIDMKGQDAAVLTALLRMKREKYVPDRDIIVAFTADEEAGGASNGVHWLLTHHRDLVDAELAVNPDGGEAGMKQGRRLYVGVETSEKMFLSFRAQATDKGGHSSRPTDGNPIYRLSAALDRLAHHQFPVHLTATTKLYFARRAGLETGQLQADMRAVAQSPPDPAALDRLSKTVETNILLRTTCVATQIDGGHAENALPQRAGATLQCRVIPGETSDQVREELAAVIADPAVTLTVLTAGRPSPEAPPSPAVLSAVEKVAHGLWPEVIVLPFMAAGASDSIYTLGAGIPSYGIDGMFDDLDDGRAHGRDERIGVQAFADEVDFTYRLMRQLSAAR